MTERIAVVGTGLMGRTVALELSMRGYHLKLFESDVTYGSSSCGYSGAGMLAPFCELEQSSATIFKLGQFAVQQWFRLIAASGKTVYLQSQGTIAIAHSQDLPILSQFVHRIRAKLNAFSFPIGDSIQWLSSEQIESLEPSWYCRFHQAAFLPEEGQVDNRQLMQALAEALRDRFVEWQAGCSANVAPYVVEYEGIQETFAMVIDCRGVGAQKDIENLRSVRGEMVVVRAPDVHIRRPIRLMHPRYPLYIVPRPDNVYLLGATSIESSDERSLTVQSALELLSASFSVDGNFADAEIIETRVNRRPALIDNNPRIFHQPGLVRINGLYRHGFLVAPQLSTLACDLIEYNKTHPAFADVYWRENVDACVSKR